MNSETKQHFTGKHAEAYDKSREKLASTQQALHLCINAALGSLRNDARVLCVGAGTGAELFAMAECYPDWSFVVVEPSHDMMQKCKEGAEARGILWRCSFHEAYLDTLEVCDPFDAATSIQVSYFILDPQERQKYYETIAGHLRDGGSLINAELVADMTAPSFDTLKDTWVSLYKNAGINLDPAYLGRDVAVIPASEVEEMLSESGFSDSVQIYQAVLICAWVSVVAR